MAGIDESMYWDEVDREYQEAIERREYDAEVELERQSRQIQHEAEIRRSRK